MVTKNKKEKKVPLSIAVGAIFFIATLLSIVVFIGIYLHELRVCTMEEERFNQYWAERNPYINVSQNTYCEINIIRFEPKSNYTAC